MFSSFSSSLPHFSFSTPSTTPSLPPPDDGCCRDGQGRYSFGGAVYSRKVTNFALPIAGMGSGSFLKVLLQNFDVLAGPVVSLVYPLYASIRAIESKSPVDDQQWLTYWVLYSLITLFELTFAKLIEWLPFWPYAKLALTCWLVIPYFSGAAYVYEHFVRPMFLNSQTVNIWYVPRKKDIFSKPDDVLFAAEKFIEENGTEAFQKLLNRAEKEGKGKRNKRVTFEDEYHHNDAYTYNGYFQQPFS